MTSNSSPNNILQWNINGLRSKITQLRILLSKYNPDAIALQETKLPIDIEYDPKNYQPFYENRNGDGGGVALLVNENIPCTRVRLTSPLEAVAVKMFYQEQTITICSLYLPPEGNFPVNDFKNLVNELPSPHLILGDYNSKSYRWGSPLTPNNELAYKRGEDLINIIDELSLCIINTGKPTYYRVNNNYYSHLDLSIGTPDISTSFNWDTDPDPHDSDHFPIIITHSLNHLYTTSNTRWDFENTSHDAWVNYSSSISLPDDIINSTEACKEITEHILEVAQQHVKIKSSNINSRYFNPWWNEDCKQATKDKRRALRILNRSFSTQNLIAFKRSAAYAKFTIKQAKKASWLRFVSTINRFTPLKTIWNKIRKIDNKSYSNTKVVLKPNNDFITEPVEVADTLGQFYSSVSNDSNYTAEFLEYKTDQEQNQIDFDSLHEQGYNQVFTFHELKTSLNPMKNSAPGEDGIPYELYKKIPKNEQLKLLNFFNFIWTNQTFPDQWKHAHVIPILKPNKLSHLPSSYRPISLTISLCKILEKMIANRLMTFLNSNQHIANHQYGFQKNKSTLDPLTLLEHEIRDTILWQEYLIVVFLDIEKAYDMVWAHGILKELYNLGLRGNLPIFIKNFMSNRTIQVKIKQYLSRKFQLNNGLPQGSILSVFLFLIAINNLFKFCNETVNNLFCDDGMFWQRDKDLTVAENKIQDTLNKLSTWSEQNGLKFSTSKSLYCIFTRNRKTRDLNLKLCNSNLPRKNEVKYLGLIFDSQLTWLPHIKYIRDRCMKRMNVIKHVANKKWGSDRKTLNMLYVSLIQSQMNYGSFLYSAAAPTNLLILDRVQYAGIRIVTGAMNCTDTKMLEAEAVIEPLRYRRSYLGLTFLGRTARLENSITATTIRNHYTFQWMKESSKPLSWIARAQITLNTMNIEYGEIANINPSFLYQIPKLEIKYSMHTKKKSDYIQGEAQQMFMEMLSKYVDFHPVFTDGSAKDNKTGCAVVTRLQSYMYRLPNSTNIFIAELYDLSKAIDSINLTHGNKFLICCDSLSVLQALEGGSPNYLVHEIYTKITNSEKQIKFEWVPSHVNLPGNNMADEKAKEALELEEIEPLPLDYIDVKTTIKKYLKNCWQQHWDETNYLDPNFLHEIKPNLLEWKSSNQTNRSEEVKLSRLRLGTCLFNRKHHFKRERHPNCTSCSIPIDVQHVIIDCPQYNNQRKPITEYLRTSNLPTSLSKILNDDFPHVLLFKFLKDINYFEQI